MFTPQPEHTSTVLTQHPFLVWQDDDYLYLVMEYLPGGDVMVRYASSPHLCAFMLQETHLRAKWAVCQASQMNDMNEPTIICSAPVIICQAQSAMSQLGGGGADAAHAQGHPERGGDALLHRGDRARAGVHPQALLHSQVQREPAPFKGRAAGGLEVNICT